MASSSSRNYVVEGSMISLDVLKAVSKLIPGPISDMLELAQKVIAMSEVRRNCRHAFGSSQNLLLDCVRLFGLVARTVPAFAPRS